MNRLLLASVIAVFAVPAFAVGCNGMKIKFGGEGAPESGEPLPPLNFDMSNCDAEGMCAVIDPKTGAVLYMTKPDSNRK